MKTDVTDDVFRSGFVALLGKPNVGKSTLLNRIVGSKVAITSSKPQTTRRRVLGVLHGDGFQVVFVDTPGISKPLHRLGEKMSRTAKSEGKEADIIVWMTEATHSPTDEDREVAAFIKELDRPCILACNKVDLCSRELALARLEEYAALLPHADPLLLSAVSGIGVSELIDKLVAQLPVGPPFFPSDQVTDLDVRAMIEEMVREKILHNTRQEVPHAVAVMVEELREGLGKGGEGKLFARAHIFVEKPSQKRILVGKGGALLKKIGKQAREELEAVLGRPLYLDLWVKVKKDWRDRDDWLAALGY